MSATKTAMTAGSMAFVLLFGGGVFLFMNLGDIAKTVAQRVASRTLGVAVSIGTIEVNVPQKSVVVKNVKVANPSGYSRAHAVTIETIHLKANTLSDTLLNFNDVSVSGSEVYLEVKSDRTNLTDIKKNLDRRAAQKDPAAKQLKVIIDEIKIDKMRVKPSITLLSDADLEPAIVPDIVLTGIGKRQGGVLAGDAIKQIWRDILPQIQKSAAGAGFYQGLSGDALREVGLQQIDALRSQAEDQIKNEVDKIGKSINGLFGN